MLFQSYYDLSSGKEEDVNKTKTLTSYLEIYLFSMQLVLFCGLFYDILKEIFSNKKHFDAILDCWQNFVIFLIFSFELEEGI